SKSFGSDFKGAYILNEAAVKEVGWKNPIGKKFEAAALNEGTIVGVVRDFNYKSLHQKINPLFIAVSPDNLNYLSIRMNAKNTPASLNYIRDEWKKIFPQSPFEYFFFDNHLDALCKSESILASMFDWFSALAIIISCLGLFGLASISTIKRTKEIGIRKVLGAPVIKIVGLISKEFIILVFIANLVALPLTWYGMGKWLHIFAYRINLQILTFLFVSCGIMAMVLFVVVLLAIKAATANPIKSLRYE
ncbi:MAG: ABC transporter permease, partial [Ignavibacteriaceae bacterium]